MKRILCLLLCAIMLICFSSCKNDISDEEYSQTEESQKLSVVEKNPIATIELSNGGKIVIELCYDAAPNTVCSFIAYVKSFAYNGFGFTEVRNNRIVMADLIDGEYIAPFYTEDEFENNSLSHERGVVTMNRTSNSNQVTGRFSVITKDSKYFDNYCSAFGRVIEGMEYIDRIAASEVNSENNKVESPVAITKIYVETFNQEIPDPVIIKKD